MTNLVEIIAFGPGYGESIIISIPGVGWGVIDSCLQNLEKKKINPPLEYLKNRNISNLAFVALTHPHLDHFAGLEEIISHYMGKIDRVCYYSGTGLREYRTYLATNKWLGSSQELDQLARVFKSFNEAQKAGAAKVSISERTSLIETIYNGMPIQVLGLAPSAESQEQYCKMLFDAIPKNEGDTIGNLSGKEHNLISVALFCTVGKVKILLGGDVELGNDKYTGWQGIVNQPDNPCLASNVVKVPHHGSEGAYCNKIWSKFSKSQKPISIITPYTHLADPLPRDCVLKKISTHSDRTLITAKHKFVAPKRIYNRTVVENIRGTTKWKCLIDNDNIGYIRICLSPTDGQLKELEVISPAYSYE